MLANTDNTKQQSKEEAVYVGNQTETETLFSTDGDFDGGALNFQAQTIIVDNFSTRYVYIQDAKRYALPSVSNQVFPANRVTNKRIRWQAPKGITQPADNGSPAIVTWTAGSVLVLLAAKVQ